MQLCQFKLLVSSYSANDEVLLFQTTVFGGVRFKSD